MSDALSDADRARLRDAMRAVTEPDAGPAARAEAGRLLDAAVASGALRAGMAADEVRALLGPPHFARGQDGDAGWGYRTAPREGEEPRGADWYVWVEMAGGMVRSVGRRAWLTG